MALPVFRSAGTKSDGTTGAVTVSAPAGLATGDLDILIATTIAGGSVSITSNGGSSWTSIPGLPQDVTGGEKLYGWWRITQAGDTSPQVTAGSDHVCSARNAWQVGTFDANDPLDVETPGSETTSDTSFSFTPGVSTSRANEIVMCVTTTGVDSNTGQVPVMTNANLTNLAQILNVCTNSGGGGGFGISTGRLVTAGAVGTFACTYSGASPKAYIAFGIKGGTAITLGVVSSTEAPQGDQYPQAPVNPTINWGTAGGGASSATCFAPQVTEGDLLLLMYRAIRGSPDHSINITGGANGQWTLLYEDFAGSSTLGRGSFYAKIAEIGDGGSYTADGPNDHVLINVAAVRVGRGNVVNRVKSVESDGAHDASAATHTIGGVTTKKDNDLVVLMVAGDGALGRDTYTATDPATLTENMQSTTVLGLDGFIVTASALKTTKGATGDVTYNSTSANSSDTARILIGITTASFIEKPKTITPADETDAALTLFVYKPTPVTEISSVQALSIVHFVTVTQASETDSAMALSLTGVTLTPAAETDTAQALDYEIVVTGYQVDPATETDSAQALSYYKTVTITQAGDTGTAPAETASKSYDVMRAAETDAAQVQTFYRTVDFTNAAESDAALSLTGGRLFELTHASETDSPQALTGYKTVSILYATETDFVRGIAPTFVGVTPATTTNNAVALIYGVAHPITPIGEVDAARIIHYTKNVTITPVTETDSARSIGLTRTVDLGFVTETDSPEPFSISHIIPFPGHASETDTAMDPGHHFQFLEGVDGHIVTGGVLTGSEPFAREGFAEDPEHGAQPHEGGVRFARKGHVF